MAALALEVLCCNLILKPFVARIRPCDINTAVQLLVPRPDDFSFPSGHTGAFFSASSALYFSRSRLRFPALVLAVLIGFSRLYLYVHYPTDVLAGAVLGALLGWAGCALAGLRETGLVTGSRGEALRVLSDTEQIMRRRQEKASAAVRDCIRQLKHLGYTSEEMKTLIFASI